MTIVKILPCDKIEATAATQIRVKLHKDVIDAYCEDIKTGADMPAVDVFCEDNSERYVMADGFHRHRATINAGNDEILCNVHPGTLHDALVYALNCNSTHGLRRNNADKRHAVEMALKDPEIGQRTRQEIADICGVTKRTVQKIANTKDIEDPENGHTVKGKSKKAEAEDFRDTGKPPPTQQEVDLEELRGALGLITPFPYTGEEAAEHLALEPDDVDKLEYVSTWCAEVVVAMRANDE